MQLGLSLEINKKKGSYMTAEEEILLIEEILKYEGTLFGKMWGMKGSIVKRKGHRSNSNCRFLIKR